MSLPPGTGDHRGRACGARAADQPAHEHLVAEMDPVEHTDRDVERPRGPALEVADHRHRTECAILMILKSSTSSARTTRESRTDTDFGLHERGCGAERS